MHLAALFMVYKENTLRKSIKGNEVFEIFFGGRYIILLMAIFSVYTGLIYNDVFSKSLNIFGSQWRVGVPNNFTFNQVTQLYLNPDPKCLNKEPKMYSGNPYPFGLDPAWSLAINKISFTNTLKMKFSIIIGIIQMVFGLILGLLNHRYFNRKLSIFFEFIPQIIFISLIFVYLCIMIFIKWIKFAGSDDDHAGACGPNLLIELINMFFLKDSAERSDGSIDPCKRLYPGQVHVQMVFVIVAVLCIPVMLLTKPLILRHRAKKQSQRGRRLHGHSNPLTLSLNGDAEHEHEGSTSAKVNGNSIVHLEEHHEEEEEEEEVNSFVLLLLKFFIFFCFFCFKFFNLM